MHLNTKLKTNNNLYYIYIKTMLKKLQIFSTSKKKRKKYEYYYIDC